MATMRDGEPGHDSPLNQCPGSCEPAATVPTTLWAITRLLGETSHAFSSWAISPRGNDLFRAAHAVDVVDGRWSLTEAQFASMSGTMRCLGGGGYASRAVTVMSMIAWFDGW